MHGATSTGNVENRRTSEDWASTDTIQGQTRGGRSAQQQAPVLSAHHQPELPCLATAATLIASRQATGSNTTESIQPQEGQCTREFSLPELRYQATMDFFKDIEEFINAEKPETSETKKPCNPESAAEDVTERFNAFYYDTLECLKESSIQQDISKDKNTLPLCLMVVEKTMKSLDGLIEELKNARKSGSSETETSCDPGPIERIANTMYQWFQALEADREMWIHGDTLPLCQAIVKEIKDLTYANLPSDAFVFMEKVISPVYMIALNGALADLKQQYSGGLRSLESFCLLVDISRYPKSSVLFEKSKMDLLRSNCTMFLDLFRRQIFVYDPVINAGESSGVGVKCVIEDIKRFVNEILVMTEKATQQSESDDAAKLNDDKMHSEHKVLIGDVVDDLASRLQFLSIHMSSRGITSNDNVNNSV